MAPTTTSITGIMLASCKPLTTNKATLCACGCSPAVVDAMEFEQHALSGVTAQDPRTEEALHGNLWIMC